MFFFPSEVPGKKFVTNRLRFVRFPTFVGRIFEHEDVPFFQIARTIFVFLAVVTGLIQHFSLSLHQILLLFLSSAGGQTLQKRWGSSCHSTESIFQEDCLRDKCLFSRQPRFVQYSQPIPTGFLFLNRSV